jgi:hypothetical protein
MIYGEREFNETLIKIIREEYRHPLYSEAVRLAKEMSVHIFGEKPKELLARVRPGEDHQITEYRLANYEPTTKAPAGRAIKITSKIFNPNLSSIIFPSENENAKRLQDYTLYYYPNYNSLTVYNKDVTLRKMLADANGLMAIKPQRIPRNDAERVKPIVVIYGSEALWNWDFDHYLVNTAIDEVPNEGKWFTFDYYDSTQYLKFRALSPKEEQIQIQILETYQTAFTDIENQPEIPAWRLRGNSLAQDNGQILYESFFADAKPHWNLSIIHESDVLGAFVKHMNPQRYVIGEECRNEEEHEGILFRCNGGLLRGIKDSLPYNFGTCDRCRGLGRIASSPYEDHVLLKSKLDEYEGSRMDPLGYVNVPVEATKMLEERADRLVKKGSAAINMDVEDEIGENQSGIAKVIDRSAQGDTLYDISVVMFDVHMQNQFYFINKYQNSIEDRSANRDTEKNLPQINKPTRFNIESIAELVNNFKAGKESGLDRNFLQAKQKEILTRDLDTNPELKKYYSAIIDLDPLFGLALDEIDSQLMKGTIRKADVTIHFNLKPFVDRAVSEDKNFLDKKKDEQLVKLNLYAEELIKASQPQVPEIVEPVEDGAE